jgi:Tol biopolymer transport system component
MKMSLISAEGGQPLKVFETSPFISPFLRWTAEGQALTYVETRGGVSNLWSQPVAGGAPKKLTDFNSDRIFRFAWSRDGRDLACERGLYVNDIVLINDFL